MILYSVIWSVFYLRWPFSDFNIASWKFSNSSVPAPSSFPSDGRMTPLGPTCSVSSTSSRVGTLPQRTQHSWAQFDRLNPQWRQCDGSSTARWCWPPPWCGCWWTSSCCCTSASATNVTRGRTARCSRPSEVGPCHCCSLQSQVQVVENRLHEWMTGWMIEWLGEWEAIVKHSGVPWRCCKAHFKCFPFLMTHFLIVFHSRPPSVKAELRIFIGSCQDCFLKTFFKSNFLKSKTIFLEIC